MKHKQNNKVSSLVGNCWLILQTGLFSFLALWNYNLGQISPRIVLKPLLYTLAFVVLVGVFWLLVARSPEKAALFSGLTFLFCFTFGHVYDLLIQLRLFGWNIGFIKLLAVYVILYVGLIILVARIKKLHKNTIPFLNIAATALLLINLVPILIYLVKTKQPAQTPSTQSTSVNSPNGQRDIYYIVLDAYARADVLQELLGYDNSQFLNGLEERGFYLPGCAFSNYNITEATIGSVLNYDYLQNMGVSPENVGKDTAENALLIWNNKVWQYLKERGYRFVTTRGYASFVDIQNSDLYLDYALDQDKKEDLSQQRLINLYLNTTIFRVVSELYKNNPESFAHFPYWLIYNLDENTELNYITSWYNQNNYVFDSLEEIPDLEGDYFVYAHINSPHPPYVYRSDGSLNYPPETGDEKTAYANTLTYLNKRVLELVDALQQGSNPQPIIIIQADHSIHMLTSGLDKHKILSAYYLPGDLITPPYDTITPVNDFPLIFKNYFDPAFELLPDMLYVKYLNDYEFVPSSCSLEP